MNACKPFIIAGRGIKSRLFLGTGKFSNPRLKAQALEDLGARDASENARLFGD